MTPEQIAKHGTKNLFNVRQFEDDKAVDITIKDFEEEIEKRIKDSKRLIIETLQLESYIFSPEI